MGFRLFTYMLLCQLVHCVRFLTCAVPGPSHSIVQEALDPRNTFRLRLVLSFLKVDSFETTKEFDDQQRVFNVFYTFMCSLNEVARFVHISLCEMEKKFYRRSIRI